MKGWLSSQPTRTKRGMINNSICTTFVIRDRIGRSIWHLLAMGYYCDKLGDVSGRGYEDYADECSADAKSCGNTIDATNEVKYAYSDRHHSADQDGAGNIYSSDRSGICLVTLLIVLASNILVTWIV